MDKLYPEPIGEEWQDKYRYAKAYEQCASDIVSHLSALKTQYTELSKKENEEEQSIDNA